MTNAIAVSNPFGAVNSEDIRIFEAEISKNLPCEYRNYLEHHNGGLPERNCFNTKKNPDEWLDLEKLYSLNGGPSYRNLNANWLFADSYDLRKYSEQLAHFIVIGTATGGAAVLLDVNSGQVLFYEPDHFDLAPEEKITSYLEPVADTFEQFIANMISESEADRLNEILDS